MPSEDFSLSLIAFTEGDGFKSTCSLKSKAETLRCPKKDQAFSACTSASLLLFVMFLILSSYFQWQDRHIGA